jgi:RimJ/RimL family protein N-acetyltransferase
MRTRAARKSDCRRHPHPITFPRVDSAPVTERLALRRLALVADVDNILALDADPQVMRHLDRPKTRTEVEREVLPALLAVGEDHPGFGTWAAETRGGEFAGWLSLRPVTPADEPMAEWRTAPPGHTSTVMLGYRLRHGAWGRGYATEGARALVSYAFTTDARERPVRRVVATTMAVNAGSRRVMEKAGLRYLRTVHLNWSDPLPGTEHGDVEYEITRAQWSP